MIVDRLVPAPWGPIHLAADEDAVVGLEVLTTDGGVPGRDPPRTRRDGGLPGGRGSSLPPAARRDARGRRRGGRGAPRRRARRRWRTGGRPPRDRRPGTGCVLDGVRRVGWGEVTSYGRLARSIGRPGAARAAAAAVGRNPIGLRGPLPPGHRRRRHRSAAMAAAGAASGRPCSTSSGPSLAARGDRIARRLPAARRADPTRPRLTHRPGQASGVARTTPRRSTQPDCARRRTRPLPCCHAPVRCARKGERRWPPTTRSRQPDRTTSRRPNRIRRRGRGRRHERPLDPDLRVHPPARPGARPRGGGLGEPRGRPQASKNPIDRLRGR